MRCKKPIITTKCYQNKDLILGAAEILVNQLHCTKRGNWVLQDWCESLLKEDQYINEYCAIQIVYVNREPVTTVIRTGSKLLMAYTKPDHRRKGYGSLAASALPYCAGQWVATGALGSYEFWSKLKYECKEVEDRHHAFIL